MEKKLTEQDEKKFKKIIVESIKLTLLEELVKIEKELSNDTELGEKVREKILKFKKLWD